MLNTEFAKNPLEGFTSPDLECDANHIRVVPFTMYKTLFYVFAGCLMFKLALDWQIILQVAEG